ncbi:MAG TPA: hypothetical protein VHY58_19310 [Streptosporangiaceae bacterium]|nr:hypothetical protein [Streptosporangiaceae bacterium]
MLHRRWARTFRESTRALLSQTQRDQFASFRSKATGWFTVAIRATLLAAGETWQIVDHYDWPVWLFWLLMVVMIGLALLNTAVQRMGAEDPRGSVQAQSAPGAEQR